MSSTWQPNFKSRKLLNGIKNWQKFYSLQQNPMSIYEERTVNFEQGHMPTMWNIRCYYKSSKARLKDKFSCLSGNIALTPATKKWTSKLC